MVTIGRKRDGTRTVKWSHDLLLDTIASLRPNCTVFELGLKLGLVLGLAKLDYRLLACTCLVHLANT